MFVLCLTSYRAVRLRKALGGGMRKPGLLAAAAMVSLDDMIPRLKTDHKHARMIAEGEAR